MPVPGQTLRGSLAVNRQQSYISHSPALGRVRARCGVRGSGEQRVSSEVTQVRGRALARWGRGARPQLVTRHRGTPDTHGHMVTWSGHITDLTSAEADTEELRHGLNFTRCLEQMESDW